MEKQSQHASKWKTIYNVVNPELFPKINSGWKNNTLLVVGTVGEDKNGLVIVEALRKLKQRGVPVSVVWISQDVSSDSIRREYFNKMTSLLDEYNLTGFWQWQKPTLSVVEEFKKARALILASNREGLPNVVCEAMFCGLPCIISDILDHPLLIQHGKSGFLFKINEADSLAQCIEDLLSLDEVAYCSLTDEARKTALRLFGERRFLLEYQDVIR